MSDLATVEKRLRQIQSQLDQLEAKKTEIDAERQELEYVSAVLHRLSGESSNGPLKRSPVVESALMELHRMTELEKATAAEAAKAVLEQTDADRKGMHYKLIAELAMERGYQDTNDLDAVAQTVRRSMHKNVRIFDFLKDGTYRLKGPAKDA
jgi:HB1, ASXL, restriction endonuclease HTH domain